MSNLRQYLPEEHLPEEAETEWHENVSRSEQDSESEAPRALPETFTRENMTPLSPGPTRERASGTDWMDPAGRGEDYTEGLSPARRAWLRGTSGFRQTLHGATHYVGEQIGSERLSEIGEEAMERALTDALVNPADVPTLQEIESLGDAGMWVQETLIENAPNLAAMAAGGVTGGGAGAVAGGQLARAAVAKRFAHNLYREQAQRAMRSRAAQRVRDQGMATGAKWGARSGAGASIYPSHMGQYATELREGDVDLGEADAVWGLAAVNSALDVAGAEVILRTIFRGMATDQAKDLVRQQAERAAQAGALRRIASETGKGAAAGSIEALIEPTHELMYMAARQYYDPEYEIDFTDPETIWRLAESSAAGGTVGATLGAAGRGGGRALTEVQSHRRKTADEVEREIVRREKEAQSTPVTTQRTPAGRDEPDDPQTPDARDDTPTKVYKTEPAAKAQRTKRGLTDHEVVEVEGGYALRSPEQPEPSSQADVYHPVTGKPFLGRRGAEHFAQQQGLQDHSIVGVDAGYIIRPHSGEPATSAAPRPAMYHRESHGGRPRGQSRTIEMDTREQPADPFQGVDTSQRWALEQRLQEIETPWVEQLGLTASRVRLVDSLDNRYARYDPKSDEIYIAADRLPEGLGQGEQANVQLTELLAHEVGHAVHRKLINNAPENVQAQIEASYQRWREQQDDTTPRGIAEGQVDRTTPMAAQRLRRYLDQDETGQTGFPTEQADYRLGYSEWLADQVARDIMGQEVMATTPGVRKFIKDAAETIRKLYEQIAQTLGWPKADPAVADFLADVRSRVAEQHVHDTAREDTQATDADVTDGAHLDQDRHTLSDEAQATPEEAAGLRVVEAEGQREQTVEVSVPVGGVPKSTRDKVRQAMNRGVTALNELLPEGAQITQPRMVDGQYLFGELGESPDRSPGAARDYLRRYIREEVPTNPRDRWGRQVVLQAYIGESSRRGGLGEEITPSMTRHFLEGLGHGARQGAPRIQQDGTVHAPNNIAFELPGYETPTYVDLPALVRMGRVLQGTLQMRADTPGERAVRELAAAAEAVGWIETQLGWKRVDNGERDGIGVISPQDAQLVPGGPTVQDAREALGSYGQPEVAATHPSDQLDAEYGWQVSPESTAETMQGEDVPRVPTAETDAAQMARSTSDGGDVRSAAPPARSTPRGQQDVPAAMVIKPTDKQGRTIEHPLGRATNLTSRKFEKGQTAANMEQMLQEFAEGVNAVLRAAGIELDRPTLVVDSTRIEQLRDEIAAYNVSVQPSVKEPTEADTRAVEAERNRLIAQRERDIEQIDTALSNQPLARVMFLHYTDGSLRPVLYLGPRNQTGATKADRNRMRRRRHRAVMREIGYIVLHHEIQTAEPSTMAALEQTFGAPRNSQAFAERFVDSFSRWAGGLQDALPTPRTERVRADASMDRPGLRQVQTSPLLRESPAMKGLSTPDSQTGLTVTGRVPAWHAVDRDTTPAFPEREMLEVTQRYFKGVTQTMRSVWTRFSQRYPVNQSFSEYMSQVVGRPTARGQRLKPFEVDKARTGPVRETLEQLNEDPVVAPEGPTPVEAAAPPPVEPPVEPDAAPEPPPPNPRVQRAVDTVKGFKLDDALFMLKYVYTATIRAEDSVVRAMRDPDGNPVMEWLADAFRRMPGVTTNAHGEITITHEERQLVKNWERRIGEIFNDIMPSWKPGHFVPGVTLPQAEGTLLEVQNHFILGTPVTSRPAQEKVKAVNALLKDVFTEMDKRGLPVKERKDFFPYVYSAARTMNLGRDRLRQRIQQFAEAHPEKFAQMWREMQLRSEKRKRHDAVMRDDQQYLRNQEELADSNRAAHQAGEPMPYGLQEVTAETIDVMTDGLYAAFTFQDGVYDGIDGDVMSPTFHSGMPRRLPEELHQFLAEDFREQDIYATLISYVRGAGKRMTWWERFAAHEHVSEMEKMHADGKHARDKLKRTLERAGIPTLEVERQLAEHQTETQHKVDQYREGIMSEWGVDPMDPIAGLKLDMKQKLRDGRLSQEDYDRLIYVSIPSYAGTLGTDSHPALRRFNQVMMVYQGVRVLTFGIFAQFVDAGFLWHRMGPGYRNEIMPLLRQLKTPESQKELRDTADILGLWDYENLHHALADDQGMFLMSPKLQKINSTFYKYNMMMYATNFARMMSANAGKNLIKKFAENGETEMLAELNITKQDVDAWVQDGAPLDMKTLKHRKVLGAIHQFTDESVIYPNAAIRPRLGNDKRFAAVWFLKTFTWGFMMQMHQRVWNQAVRRWGEEEGARRAMAATPAIMLAAATIPIAAASMELRWFIAGNRMQPDMFEQDWWWEAIQRSGITGIAQLGFDANRAHEFGQTGIGALAGPTGSQIEDVLTNGINNPGVWERSLPMYQGVRRVRELLGDE